MNSQSAFTPLRVALMVLITICNICALFAFVFSDANWSKMLGIFSAVFILLFVFVQLLELVWLYSFKKQQENSKTIQSYQKAINIYLTLYVVDFIMVYLVLS